MTQQKNEASIRICHLIDFYPPLFIGGLELHSYDMAEMLLKKGVNTFVITRKIDSHSKSFEQLGNIDVRRISPKGQLRGKGWKALFPTIYLIIKLIFLLIRYKKQYDIILVSGLKVLATPAIIAKYILNKKCVIMVVSPDELGQDIFTDESLRKMRISRSSILVKLIRKVRNGLINKADSFTVLSAEIEKQIDILNINPGKVYTIPNGINTKKFHPISTKKKIALRKKLSLPENKIIFTYAGRIAKAKGVMNLIEAWNSIVKKYNNIYLIYTGSGEGSYDFCKDELLKYIKDNNLSKDVLVTGYVDEMHEYLQAADVFVFPSDYEGFGLVILEGLACGLPSVITKVGAAAEVINNYENGVVVPPKNKEKLYEGINWMLENKKLWESMGKKARISVEKYSLEVETDKYFEMFAKTMQKNNKK
ncbi:MAG: glycosyltransferase family 4 protein [Ignavibacteriaceae bacterium]